MKNKLITLVLLVFAMMFTRDAIFFPAGETASTVICHNGASSLRFSRNNSTIMLECFEGKFNIRCDVNEALCAMAERGRVRIEDLQILRISTLGDYVALNGSIENKSVSYADEVKAKLPRARNLLWIYVAMMWIVFLVNLFFFNGVKDVK